MPAQVAITVANVGILLDSGFTTIEIWCSTNQGGNYAEITAPTALPAILTSEPARNTFAAGGKTLEIGINLGPAQSITFSDVVKHWTPTQVANRINEVIVGLASVSNNSIVLTGSVTGRANGIQIHDNDIPDLFWKIDRPRSDLDWIRKYLEVNGKDVRIALDADTLIYTYFDPVGTRHNRYKWRFSKDGLSPTSEFSDRVYGSIPPLSGVPLSVATATFIGLGGRAQKTRIIIVTDNPPLSTGDYVVGSTVPLIVDSDEEGFLQVPLVQGARVRVAIEGTAFVREITVPTSPSFDLLQTLSAAPDPFTIQTSPPYIIRRSI